MEVIPNFVDTARFSAATRERARRTFAGPGEHVLIHISNFRPVKRVGDVVDVFARVVREVPARLLMVGDGPELGAVQQQVAELGLTSQVDFLGRQDGVEAILPAADVFLLPSDAESFGLAALEAQACEVPVIGAAAGGLPEVVEHGVTGYLEPVGDVAEMARCALRILTEPGRRQAMGAAARARARETLRGGGRRRAVRGVLRARPRPATHPRIAHAVSLRRTLELLVVLSLSKGGVLTTATARADEPTFDLGLVTSVAVTDDAAALVANPAALAFRGDAELVLSRSTTRDGLRFQNAVVKASGSELAWQEWRDFQRDHGQRRFSTALSAPLGRSAWVGFALHHLRPATAAAPFETFTTLDLGALLRPARWLSVGAVVRDPTRPTDRPGHTVRQRYTAGLAFRPFAERVTFAADLTFTNGRDLNSDDFQFFAMTELTPGLGLDLSVRGDGEARVALALSGRRGRLALSTLLDDQGRAASRFGVIHLSSSAFRPLPLSRRRVLGLSLRGELSDATPQWSLLRGSGLGLDRVREELDRARHDRRVGAVLVEFEGLSDHDGRGGRVASRAGTDACSRGPCRRLRTEPGHPGLLRRLRGRFHRIRRNRRAECPGPAGGGCLLRPCL